MKNLLTSLLLLSSTAAWGASYPGGGGGSGGSATNLTPWSSDINGAGFNLTTVAKVTADEVVANLSHSFLGANTNVSITNVTSVIKATNQFWNAYNVVFSNSVLDVAGEPQPVLWPFGGEYIGLHITNSPTIAATHEQACIGFPQSTQFPIPGTAKNIIVRDSIFWADGLESDAASFKTSLTTGASTNNYYFWNDLFHAQKYGFNQVGYGNYNFYNCLFDAAVGFLPDQGPNTNRLQGCLFNVVQGTLDVGAGSAGSGAAGLLIQLRSRTTVVGGQMNIITTNAAGDSTGIAWSAEGDYYAIIKNMHFHLAGPGTNCISDFTWAGSAGAANCLLVLDDVTYDGANSASGGWLVNNSVSPSPTIIVMGGNLSPTNFTDPSSVTFLTPFQAGTNISVSGSVVSLQQALTNLTSITLASGAAGLNGNGGPGTNFGLLQANSITATNGTDYIGLLNFPADLGGAFIDLSVTAATANTVKIGYTNRLDGNDVTRTYATSDGAGGISIPSFDVPAGIASLRSNTVALFAITLGASPYTWVNTNSCNGFVLVAGGTVSAVTLNGTALPTAFLAGSDTLPMQKGESVVFTYTVAPTVLFKPF